MSSGATVVSELNVLLATLKWLLGEGWSVDGVSIATGSGLAPIEEQKEEVKRVLNASSWLLDEYVLDHRGPDIVASRGQEVWKFECKGHGKGKRATLKNNFDRAVASVVSYYDDHNTLLGLALPDDYLWKYDYGSRLPSALRGTINLWVFLYDPKLDSVYPFEPGEELPYPEALE